MLLREKKEKTSIYNSTNPFWFPLEFLVDLFSLGCMGIDSLELPGTYWRLDLSLGSL
jgi:hypothetical protein